MPAIRSSRLCDKEPTTSTSLVVDGAVNSSYCPGSTTMLSKVSLCVCLVLQTCFVSAQFVANDDAVDISLRQSKGTKCNFRCSFDLCQILPGQIRARQKAPKALVRQPRAPWGGALCRKNKLLTNVKVGEAFVSPEKSGQPFVPISSFRPAGLNMPFKRNYFTVISGNRQGQALGRRRSRGNQDDFVGNLCVVLPIKRYQVVNKKGVPGPITKSSKPSDCVLVRTVATKLILELTWDSQDDLDMLVEEPTGFLISRFNLESPRGGRLTRDTGSASQICTVRPEPGDVRRESVRYVKTADVPAGTFVVRIEHLRNCGRGPTNFKVRVIVDGIVVQTRKGATNGKDRDLAGSFSFDIFQ